VGTRGAGGGAGAGVGGCGLGAGGGVVCTTGAGGCGAGCATFFFAHPAALAPATMTANPIIRICLYAVTHASWLLGAVFRTAELIIGIIPAVMMPNVHAVGSNVQHLPPDDARMSALLEATAEAERSHFWFRGFRRFVTPMLEAAARGRRDLLIADCGAGTGNNLALLRPFGTAIGVELNQTGAGLRAGAARRA
jgi:hypothetical protein